MMLIFGILLAAYIFWRGILPLRVHWGWKAVLALAVLAVGCKFHLLHLVGGPMFFAPELPIWVLKLAAWLFAILFIFFFLLLAANITAGLWWLVQFCVKRKKPERGGSVANRLNLSLLIFSVLLASAGFVAGTRIPAVHAETIVLDHLPKDADGFTIAVLADLHVDSMMRASHVREIVNRTNALKPDMIVIAGDFVDGTVNMRAADMLPLAELSAKYGVFGVPGNHEYYSGYEEWMEYLSDLGIRMLANSHVLSGNNNIAVLGVTDPVAERFGKELPDIDQAMEGIPDGVVKILLAHQPRLAPEAADKGVDLQISGHTHGGLIKGIDQIIARFNAGYVSGLYTVGKMKLYVSKGTGIWHGFPIRIGVPSEILLLRLRQRAS